MRNISFCMLVGVLLATTCYGAPTRNGCKLDENNQRPERPRCLSSFFSLGSLFGGLTDDAPQLPDISSMGNMGSMGMGGMGMGSSGLGGLPGSGQFPGSSAGFGSSGLGGLQGGAQFPGSGAGFGSSGSSGLGLPSQYTPGLGQASGALQHSQFMEGQLFGAQSQLGGVGSNIPSSSDFFRNGGFMGQTDLSPPPTIFRHSTSTNYYNTY